MTEETAELTCQRCERRYISEGDEEDRCPFCEASQHGCDLCTEIGGETCISCGQWVCAGCWAAHADEDGRPCETVDNGDTYIEHSQVGRVRIIAHADTVEVAWYDYNGNSSVTDAWLSQAVATVRGGNWWRVTARHHAGNGHFSADLRQGTLDSLVEDALTQKPLAMDAIDIHRLRRHVLTDALSMGWSDGISTTAYLCGAPLLCLACGKVGDFVEHAPSRCETCNKTRMSMVG